MVLKSQIMSEVLSVSHPITLLQRGVFQLYPACCSGCGRADKKLWADTFPALQAAPFQEGAPSLSLCETPAECPLRP